MSTAIMSRVQELEDRPTTALRKKSLTPGLTRQTHTKSRNGCLMCKSRRVKCSETRPSCRQCVKKQLQCQYSNELARHERVEKSPISFNSDVPNSTMDDLKALHQFLIFCPLAVPIGNHGVWTKDVPQLAHQKPFLMHAILGLGLSHHVSLTDCETADDTRALQHRQHAISGLRQHMNESRSWKLSDADAAIATMYALTFQTSHMPSGLADYETLLRGCALITESARQQNLETTFDLSTTRVMSKYRADIATLLPEDAPLDLVMLASAALEELSPHLTNPMDRGFFTAIQSMISRFLEDGPVAILGAIDGYSQWYGIGYTYFRRFLDPMNTAGILVLEHFLCIQMMLLYLLPLLWWPHLIEMYPPGQLLLELRGWIESLHKAVPADIGFGRQWPESVLKRVPSESTGSSRSIAGSLGLQEKMAKAQKMHQHAHVVLGGILQDCAGLAGWLESVLHRKLRR